MVGSLKVEGDGLQNGLVTGSLETGSILVASRSEMIKSSVDMLGSGHCTRWRWRGKIFDNPMRQTNTCESFSRPPTSRQADRELG